MAAKKIVADCITSIHLYSSPEPLAHFDSLLLYVQVFISIIKTLRNVKTSNLEVWSQALQPDS